jgi:CheY-like chemotaxis protein
MTILIVEDEPKVHTVLKTHFETQGHQVWVSQTGEGALALLQQHQPDAMLLDLWLKGPLNGLGVIKETPRLAPKTAVIVITGFEEPPQEELRRLGVRALLKKPIRLDELDQLLAQVRQSPTTP